LNQTFVLHSGQKGPDPFGITRIFEPAFGDFKNFPQFFGDDYPLAGTMAGQEQQQLFNRIQSFHAIKA